MRWVVEVCRPVAAARSLSGTGSVRVARTSSNSMARSSTCMVMWLSFNEVWPLPLVECRVDRGIVFFDAMQHFHIMENIPIFGKLFFQAFHYLHRFIAFAED